jgi:hypothetical protein
LNPQITHAGILHPGDAAKDPKTGVEHRIKLAAQAAPGQHGS